MMCVCVGFVCIICLNGVVCVFYMWICLFVLSLGVICGRVCVVYVYSVCVYMVYVVYLVFVI